MKKEPINKLTVPKKSWNGDQQEFTRLREDIFRTDLEKFRLFTQMLRRNSMLNKAIISHK